MKKRMMLLGMGFLALAIGLTSFYLKFNESPKITFEQCTKAGGVAWHVDLYHPDICSSCAEYRACEEASNGSSNIREACPQIVSCTECLQRNFPYPNKCPDGREKIGEISDAEIWFQCCK